MFGKMFCFWAFLALISPAGAEYYQYTDQNGQLRFTDDLSQVPASRRDTVEVLKSQTGTPSQENAGVTSLSPKATARPDGPSGENVSPASGITTFEIQATELNRTQERLRRMRQELDKERTALNAREPGRDATSDEKIVYSLEIEALNEKIARYTQELRAFEEKVAEFNAGNRDGKSDPE